jgi:hypothetical protein
MMRQSLTGCGKMKIAWHDGAGCDKKNFPWQDVAGYGEMRSFFVAAT